MACKTYTTVYGGDTELKCETHGLIRVFTKEDKVDSVVYNNLLKSTSDAHKAANK